MCRNAEPINADQVVYLVVGLRSQLKQIKKIVNNDRKLGLFLMLIYQKEKNFSNIITHKVLI